jgi:hypothetical protein
MLLKYKYAKVVVFVTILLVSLSGSQSFVFAGVQPPSGTLPSGQNVTGTCSNNVGTCATCQSANAADCVSDNQDPAASNCGENGCDITGKYIDPAITLLSGLVGIIAVISLIVGGIQYSTSAGDPQKAAKAKGRILNTVIALVAYFFLYALLEFLVPGGIFK